MFVLCPNFRVDLVKSASSLYLHKLTSTLDQAVRNTNASHEHPEVLKRLDVRLLEVVGVVLGASGVSQAFGVYKRFRVTGL